VNCWVLLGQSRSLTSSVSDWLAGAGEDCERDSSEDDDDDDDDDSDVNLEVDPALVQQSLLNTPNSPAFRDWEKYTKVSCHTAWLSKFAVQYTALCCVSYSPELGHHLWVGLKDRCSVVL